MHNSTHLDRRSELVLFDEKSIRSLANLVPEAVAIQMRLLWSSEKAQMLGMNERQLAKELRRAGKDLSPLDHELRAKFWLEYDRTQAEDDRTPAMNFPAVLGTSIAKEVFYKFYITDPYRLAFMLCPPQSYVGMVNTVLNASTTKILEILEESHKDPSGYINHNLVEKFIKINEQAHNKYLAMRFKVSGGKPEKPVKEEKKAKPEAEVPREPTVAERLAAKRLEIERLQKERAAAGVGAVGNDDTKAPAETAE